MITQDRQANVPVAVDVGMNRDLASDKHNLGRLERVGRRKLEPQREPLVLVQRPGGADQVDGPLHQRVGAVREDYPLRGTVLQLGLLAHQAFVQPRRAGHCLFFFLCFVNEFEDLGATTRLRRTRHKV